MISSCVSRYNSFLFLSTINSKKLNSLNFDRLEINGKLTKGNLRIILEDQYKNKIIQNKMDQIWDDVLESKSL